MPRVLASNHQDVRSETGVGAMVTEASEDHVRRIWFLSCSIQSFHNPKVLVIQSDHWCQCRLWGRLQITERNRS